jgi:hypothetical protein
MAFGLAKGAGYEQTRIISQHRQNYKSHNLTERVQMKRTAIIDAIPGSKIPW